MISSSLIVEGVPPGAHHRPNLHHHHDFSSIHNLTGEAPPSSSLQSPSAAINRIHHNMSSSTFVEPFLKTTNNSQNPNNLLKHTEFVRPLPKPAPIVATRYHNGVAAAASILNGGGNNNIKSRLPLTGHGKYHPAPHLVVEQPMVVSGKYSSEIESQGPVNLAQPKDTSSSSSSSDSHYGIYNASARLFHPAYNPNYLPSPTIQPGPYGTLYPPNPFTPVLHNNRPAHSHMMSMQQQYPNANTPMQQTVVNTISSATGGVVCSQELPPVSITTTGSKSSLCRTEKRNFKVPSGKEGSLKHRILTSRPEMSTSNKKNQRNTMLPPPAPLPISTSTVSTTSSEISMEFNKKTHSSENSVAGLTNGGGTIITTNAVARTSENEVFENCSKGALIRLASGQLKKVEDMTTDDFLSCAENNPAVQIDPSTVVRIQGIKSGVILTFCCGEDKNKVDYETPVDRPYFVFGRGWSSCDPNSTLRKYSLQCHQLQVGDVCVSLIPKIPPPAATVSSAPQPVSSNSAAIKRKSTPPRKSSSEIQYSPPNNRFKREESIVPPSVKLNDLRINDYNNSISNSNNINDKDINSNNKYYDKNKIILPIVIANESNKKYNDNNNNKDNRFNGIISANEDIINNEINHKISNVKNCVKFEEKQDNNSSSSSSGGDNNNNNQNENNFGSSGADVTTLFDDDDVMNRKKRRWSAPDHFIDEIGRSPTTHLTPISSTAVSSTVQKSNQ